MYQACTFKPEINAVSRTIAPGGSITDRLVNNEAVKRKEKLRAELQAEQEKQCTFAPQTNLAGKRKYEDLESIYNAKNGQAFSANLKAQLKEK